MATSATTATFSCPIRGDDGGAVDAFVQWAITTPQALEFQQELTGNAFNFVPFLTFPKLAIIIPPTTMLNTITLKHSATPADAGIIVGTQPTILFLNGLNDGIGIHLGAGVNANFKFRVI